MKKYIPNNKLLREALTKKELALGYDCETAIKCKSVIVILDELEKEYFTKKSLMYKLDSLGWDYDKIQNYLHSMVRDYYFGYDDDNNIIPTANRVHKTGGIWFQTASFVTK